VPSWEDVAAIGERLPGVEVGTWYGTPGLKLGSRGFCRLRTNPDALVVRVADLDDKEALLEGNPEIFFTTPHYEDSPHVLVRLDRVEPGQLAELIEDAWRSRGGK